MKNLLALIGLVVVGGAGLGWHLGWYQIGSEPGESGHRKIEVDVNTQKVAEDLKKGRETVGTIVNNTVPEKKVEGQTASFSFDPDVKLPPLPPLPAPPMVEPGNLVNPDGTLKTKIPPPPDFRPGS